MDLGEESARPKAGHHGAQVSTGPPGRLCPFSVPRQKTAMRPRLPPPPQKLWPYQLAHQEWGFGGKGVSGGRSRSGRPAARPQPRAHRPSRSEAGRLCGGKPCPAHTSGVQTGSRALVPGVPGWQRGHPLTAWPCLSSRPPARSPSISPQVSCSYVGCGESFADHSTLHAQVSVGPKVRPQLQPPPGSTRLSGPRRLCV